jgi:hypothetical protein
MCGLGTRWSCRAPICPLTLLVADLAFADLARHFSEVVAIEPVAVAILLAVGATSAPGR